MDCTLETWPFEDEELILSYICTVLATFAVEISLLHIAGWLTHKAVNLLNVKME